MKLIKHLSAWFAIILFFISLALGFYMLYRLGYSGAVVILVAVYTVNLFFIIVVFLQKRHAKGKLSWVLIMSLFPLVGQFMFAIFGQRYRDRKTILEYRKRDNFKHEQINDSFKLENKGLKALFVKQSHMSNRGVYKSKMNIYKTGDKSYEKMFEDMEKAKKFIHIHFYIIKPGEIYEHFRDILARKVKQGVEIRFIIDDFGRWAMPWYEINALQKMGIEIEIFGKVRLPFAQSDGTYRTHRKIVIIDGNIVHSGGLNISDEYSNLDKHFGLWVDCQSRIKGKAVRSFSLMFIEDWYQFSGKKLDYKKYLIEKESKDANSSSILIEDSPEVTTPVIQNSLVNMIYNAKKSISLTSPYFVPTPEVLEALKTACLSGVKVEIFIPGKADKKTAIIATRYFAAQLAEVGAKVYAANNMLIHSKIGLFDNKYAYIGSINIDTRSLYAQFELMSLIEGKAIDEVINLFEYYRKLSSHAKLEDLRLHRFKELFLRFYVNLFSPIM